MIAIYVSAIGVRGPGLDGWTKARDVLAGRAPYTESQVALPELNMLPAAERRRAVPCVRLALAVAEEAVSASACERSALATTFTSSAGDSRTLHEIMQVLSGPVREVSPTRFHNSVHNAPAGYWHIAAACREYSTSLSCHDASFAAGLLDAAAFVAVEHEPMLLVAYDLPYPEPLNAVRPIKGSFGVAFHLTPDPEPNSFARLQVELVRETESPARMEDTGLEALRAANPAARSLPLLSVLAREATGRITFDYVAGNNVAVHVAPHGMHAVSGAAAGEERMAAPC